MWWNVPSDAHGLFSLDAELPREWYHLSHESPTKSDIDLQQLHDLQTCGTHALNFEWVPLIHSLDICEVPKLKQEKIGGSFLVEQSQFNLQIGSSFPSRHNNVWTHDLGPTSTFDCIDTVNLIVPATMNEMCWNYAQLWSNNKLLVLFDIFCVVHPIWRFV